MHFARHLQGVLPAFLSFSIVESLKLKAITDPSKIIPNYPQRRAVSGPDAFDPQNEAKFYFGAQSGADAWIGEFTLMKPGEQEAIIPIERFAEQLKAINCDEDSISVEFGSQESFDHASDVWNWVNQDPQRTFTLVTAPGQCDPDAERDPFSITDVAFDGLKAELNATRLSWKEVADNFDFSTRYSKLEKLGNPERPQRLKRVDPGPDSTRLIDASEGPYKEEDLNEQLDNVDALAKKLEKIANGDGTDAKMDETALEEEVTKVMAEATDYIEEEAKEVLEKVVKDDDDHDNSEAAQNALDTFKNKAAEADKMYKEAADEADDTKSEGLVEEALTKDNEAASGLFEVVDELSVSLSGARPSLLNASAEEPETRRGLIRSLHRARRVRRRFGVDTYAHSLDKRGLFDAAKKWLKWVRNNWRTLKKVVNGVVAVFQFITADGPTTLAWDTRWEPTIYKTDAKAVQEFGLEFEAKAKIATSGTIIGQVDLGFRDRKLSQYDVNVNAKAVAGSVDLDLTASGDLKKALEVIPVSHAVPLGQYQGQKIQIFGKEAITIGPFLNVSVHAGFPELKGKGELQWGFRAKIPDDSKLHLSAEEEKPDIQGWKPEFSTVGPTIKSSMEGKLRAAVVLRSTFEAVIFGNGANVTLEAELPNIGIAFRPQACNTDDKIKGVGVSPYLGLNLTATGEANAKAWALKPKFTRNLYQQTWSLLDAGASVCLPLTKYEGNVGDKSIPSGELLGDLDGDGELDDNESPSYDGTFPPEFSPDEKFEGMTKDFLEEEPLD